MALTYSQMLPLGSPAPDFRVPDYNGKSFSLSDFKDAPALLVMFICNHCPYVQHVRPTIAKLTAEYKKKGVASVAINSNDVERYPSDSPAMMAEEVQSAGYTFPYLVDKSQSVAKAYRAACTPEFFVFDKDRKLYYRGRLDGSTPGGKTPTTGEDLRRALDSLLAGKPASKEQIPSMGCNIKWTPGNEPDYFNN
jgi:peroxiredoxin